VIQTGRQFSINPLPSITITTEKKKKPVQENQLTRINQQKLAIQKSKSNLNGYYFLTTGYVACKEFFCLLLACISLHNNNSSSSRCVVSG
jgi:hypothetical protein